MPYTFNVVTLSAGALTPLEKLQVTVLDRAGDRSDAFGSALTDAQGRATVSFDLAQFPNKPPNHLPNIFFRILDGSRLVHSTMAAPLEALAPGTYDFVFEIDLKQAVSELCVVTGRITDTEGMPAASVRVHITDCEMLVDQQLGLVNTDTKGIYLHTYSLSESSRDESRTADLRIRVLDDNGEEIAKSPIFRNASQHQVIDLTVPASVVPRRPSEWRWILARTTAVAQGRAAHLWTDENLEFLHFECGIDANHLRWFRQDARWALEQKQEPSLCYALLRMGEPEKWEALLRRTPNSRRAALKAAQAGLLIDVFPSATIEAFLQRMMDMAIDVASRDPSPDAPSATLPIGALLAASNVPAETQRRIVEVALSLEEPPQLWEALSKDPKVDEQSLRAARYAVDSYELFDRDFRVAKALPRLNSVVELAGLTEQQRLDAVERMGEVLGDKAEIAEALGAKIELAFPTPVVAFRMVQNSRSDAGQIELGNFLLRNLEFDLLTTPPKAFMRNGANLDGITDLPAFEARLSGAARIARFAPKRNRYDWIDHLGRNGLDSAPKVVALGRPGFMATATPIAGSVAAAEAYDNAVVRNAYLQLSLLRFNDVFLAPAAVVTPVRPATGEPTDWVRQFGTLNACLCDECESVHGPAAYLVALVKYLCDAPSGSIYEVVKLRRPDIDAIELNCANAHTPLPYIDLVNEILELAVAPPNPAHTNPDYRTWPSYQTVGTTDDDKARLRAEPAHRWGLAYTALAGAKRLFQLPFLLAQEEASLFGGLAGIELTDLSTWLGAEAGQRHVDRLSLGISAQVAALIESPNRASATVLEVWGGDSESWQHVDWLVTHTGIEADDFAVLVRSDWFAPLDLDINHHGHPCQIEEHRLAKREGETLQQLAEDELARVMDLLHRFVRLRAALGIPALALSQVLAWRFPLNAADPDHDAIDLSDVRRVVAMAKRLGLPLGRPGLADNASLRQAVVVLEDEWSILADLRSDRVDPFKAARQRPPAADKPVDLAVLEAWLDDRDFLRDSGIDMAELRYLVRGIDLVPEVFAPTSGQLAQWLQGVYEAMRRGVTAVAAEGMARDPEDKDLLTALRQTALEYLSGVLSLNTTVAAPLLAPLSDEADSLIRASDSDDRSAVDAFVAMVHRNEAVPLPVTVDKLPEPVRLSANTALTRALRAGRLVQLFELTAADVRSLAMLPSGDANVSGFLDLNTLPRAAAGRPTVLEGIRNLWLARELGKSFAHREVSVFGLVQTAHAATEAAPVDIIAQLEAASGWGGTVDRMAGVETLRELARLLGVHTAERLRRARAYGRLYDFTRWVQQRRLNLADLLQLRSALPAFLEPETEGSSSLGTVLRDLAWRRYSGDIAALHAALTPAMDRLRARRRDALVAYLLAYGSVAPDGTRAPMTWKDADDLYAYFLIDVQMGPCLQSSRIVQAHNALQMFVQRCLFAIEDDVRLGTKAEDSRHWRRWEWMKNYRVWEAARKVFLYPENWIEPELLDEKSPIYRQLETALLQDELKQESAERAVRDYIQGLHDVARLEVMSLFEEVVAPYGASQAKLIHVVARTEAAPHVYFYRCRRADQTWSAWEKIDLSINADQVVLAVHNRRPMLFWPTMQEILGRRRTSGSTGDESAGSSGADTAIDDRSGENTQVRIGWQVQMSWATREQIGWGNPKSANQTVAVYETEKDRIALFLGDLDEELRVEVRQFRAEPIREVINEDRDTIGYGDQHFEFDIDGCTGSVAKWPLSGAPILYRLPSLNMKGNRFVSNKRGRTSLRVVLHSHVYEGQYVTLTARFLDTSRGPIRITPSHQFCILEAFQPFVISNTVNQFFVSMRIGREYRHDMPGISSSSRFGEVQKYQFENFYHPYACLMLRVVIEDGVEGFYRPKGPEIEDPIAEGPVHRFHRQLVGEPVDAFGNNWLPNDWLVWRSEQSAFEGDITAPSLHPVANFDFANAGAYSAYNWELFFHIPLLIAERLKKQNRFADARRWLHYIFDPTDVSPFDSPQKYWRIKPFFEEAKRWGGPTETLDEMTIRLSLSAEEIIKQVEAWLDDPFNPHRLARQRLVAYMKTVVIKYLDNLLAWGDSLFAQFTMESINEAMQVYVLASQLLGPRPLLVSPPPRTDALTIAGFFASSRPVDRFDNLLIDIDTSLPSGGRLSPSSGDALPPDLALYFCIPANAKLLEYWDTVEDRLFKIRHCQDIGGRSRQLPLFAPPIDPALLVRARAAGLDLNEVLSMVMVQTGLSHRFPLMLQKAMEVCGEVRSLGSAFLAAMEKKDNEEMTMLRARQESALLTLIEAVKQQQVDETTESLAALRISRSSAQARRDFYSNREFMNMGEISQVANLSIAQGFEVVGQSLTLAASIAHAFPDVTVGPCAGSTQGGTNAGNALRAAGGVLSIIAAQHTFAATMSAIMAGHQRRQDDWDLQSELAEKEISQIDKQILAAEIRQSIATKDLSNHRAQIQHAQDVLSLLSHKFTNAELHGWMSGQLAALHHEAYRLAFDLALRAQKAAQFELGLDDSEFSYIHFGHWDSLRKGLLAGERLAMELRQMEIAYMDHRRTREFEITKHISLRQLPGGPEQLLWLRTSGQCDVKVPESVFEQDFSDHFFRCIKSVSLSVPCVVGPYGGVPATLTLSKSTIKDENNVAQPRDLGPTTSIATSGGQSDSGMFELNFREERYLPFEGAGVDSEWTLSLPPPPNRAFDYDTISDVILHMRYTARGGGTAVKPEIPSAGSVLISLRHDFPRTWSALRRDGEDEVSVPPLSLSKNLFPLALRDMEIHTAGVHLWFEATADSPDTTGLLQAVNVGTVSTRTDLLGTSLPGVVAIADSTDAPTAVIDNDPVPWTPFSSSAIATSRAAWRRLKNCYLLVDYTALMRSGRPTN